MDFNHPLTSPEQMAFEPLLVQHSVDLVLVGHEHCYERIHPVINGTVTDKPSNVTSPDGNDVYRSPTAPAHIVIGSAGALQEEVCCLLLLLLCVCVCVLYSLFVGHVGRLG